VISGNTTINGGDALSGWIEESPDSAVHFDAEEGMKAWDEAW